MIKRLWFLFSTGWAILFLLAHMTFSPHPTDRDHVIALVIAALPWLIGYGLVLAVRFIVRGDPRERVFQPPPQRYY